MMKVFTIGILFLAAMTWLAAAAQKETRWSWGNIQANSADKKYRAWANEARGQKEDLLLDNCEGSVLNMADGSGVLVQEQTRPRWKSNSLDTMEVQRSAVSPPSNDELIRHGRATLLASPDELLEQIDQRCGESEMLPVAIAKCLLDEEHRYGLELAERYRLLMVQQLDVAKNLLRDSQRAWLTYQKASCGFHQMRFASERSGIDQVARAHCLLRTTLQRLDELRDLDDQK